MRLGLVIFDCDGTLVDSEVLGNRVLCEMAAEHGLPLALEEALTVFKGTKMAEQLLEIERRLGRRLPEDFVPEFRRRTAAAFESSLVPVEGALDVVRTLRSPKCVASSGPPEKIALTLSLTGLLPHFEEHIFSSYEVGSWKPDPGLFLHVAEVMGFEPEECVVVEDSAPGFQAGLAAGMRTFAYTSPDQIDRLPEGVTPIHSLAELRRHLPAYFLP